MSAVNIKGTFSKSERTDNGLESIAGRLVEEEFSRFVVVGIVEQHKVVKVPGEPPTPTIRFVAIEPLRDTAAAGRALLDEARKERGLSAIADTLFDAEPQEFDFDGSAVEGRPVELDGQEPLIRIGSDGPREVPPPSAEELAAEAREAAGDGD